MSAPEKWKVGPLVVVEASVLLKKSRKGARPAKREVEVPIAIIETGEKSVIAECPRDSVLQGEKATLRIRAYREGKKEDVTFEIDAKAAKLTLGAGQEGDIAEFQFSKWDKESWSAVCDARAEGQQAVDRVFQALKR